VRKVIVAVLLVVFLASGLLAACEGVTVTGSGNLKTETFNLSDFTKVEAHSGFQLELTKSSIFSVEITADDNVLEDIDIDKSGDTLRIIPKRNRTYRSVTFRANITMPDLYKIDLSGGSRANITGFGSSHDLSVELSGGSGVAGDITAGDADFDLSGGSQVNLEGTANDLVVNGSGGSQLDLEAFPVNNADVELSGGGSATVDVNGTLDVNLSGGSRVTYVGEPTLGDIDLSGDSTVTSKEITGDIIALTNVNVIPMDKEQVLSDQTVIVIDGKISRIGSTASIRMPSGATKIDGTGKYLIPALSDMHVHMIGLDYNLLFPPDAQLTAEQLDYNKILFPYVANGVAIVAVMTALEDQLTIRDQIAKGEVIGPRLILNRMIEASGASFPEPIADWADDTTTARKAVLDAKEAGYDGIKPYEHLNQESYDSILATAKEVGLPTNGHIPVEITLEQVLEAGQSHIVHVEEVTSVAQGNFSPERIEHFAGIISDTDTWVSPTLITSRTILALFDDHEKAMSKPEMLYAQHPMQQAFMGFLLGNYLQIPEQHRQGIRDGFEQFGRPFTKALQDKGVKMMTGTDTGLPALVPGFALHEELEELVSAGLTPYQALRASTTNPYEFLGELEDAGTVEVGKRANLVLLEANPLENISNTQKIAGVMIQSRWLSKADIQTGMDEVVAYFETFKK
jgi:hypothetical protein